MAKLVLIDGHSILNRAFFGMPDLTNSAGVHTGAVYGFLNILFRILEEESPEYLAVAFDVHAPTFRHDVYAEYKGTRKPMAPELREQVPLIKRVLTSMGILIYEQAGLEADDILGTLAKKAAADGMDVSLISGDRDLLQIADEKILVRIPKTRAGQTTIEDYRAQDVVERYRVTPRQFIDLKALMGDSSDNVPGVPRVGEKTATDLIVKYGSVDGVYAHLDEISRTALRETLAQNEELARLSLFLVTIKTDCAVELDTGRAKIGDFYTPEAFRIFTELGFRNFLNRFENAEESAGADKVRYEVILEKDSFKAFEEELAASMPPEGGSGAPVPSVAVFPVCDRPDYGTPDEMLGLAAAWRGGVRYVRIMEGAHNGVTGEMVTSALGRLRQAAAAGRCRVIGWYLKDQYAFWGIDARAEFAEGIRLDGMEDLLIAAYLNNPLKSDYTVQDAAQEYLGRARVPDAQFLGKEKTWRAALLGREDETMAHAAAAAKDLYDLADPVLRRLADYGMTELYRTVEMPLTYILYDMQRLGIRIDPAALRRYGDELTGRIEELDRMIHEEADDPDFNIASPKQLGEILFERMFLPGAKKTKTGYSTSADVLEKLAPDYPIVRHVLEYRGLTKLKSTYADGLAAFVAPDLRIHTTFNQTITATGRISSNEPNLQNIPMRTDLGKKIRRCFLPREGWSFTDADYSQIELRILAHMSGDEELINAYRENRDIHRITAAKVFHTPFEEVTPAQRSNAKAVNFGIVYGISSFGLSQDLSISRKEAAEYIDAYFATYPQVHAFLNGLVEYAKDTGCARTIYGRRRPVPEISSSNFMTRQFGERVAMNSPIQGTAADIMKIAMIRVWQEIRRRGLQSEMILQIHDELLIETAPGEEDQVAEILRDEMQRAADLSVTLEVDVEHGSDWYMAK